MSAGDRDNTYGLDEWQKAGVRTPSGWRGHYFGELPDYLNDLNAMHEAERVIPENLRGAYTTTLHIFSSHYADEREWLAIHSTAAQRAEALLRTINKWNHLQ